MQLKKTAWVVLVAGCLTGGSFLATATLSGLGPVVVQAQQAAPAAPETRAKPTPQPAVEPGAMIPAKDLSRAFRAVHESMKGAVVNINTIGRTGGPGGLRMDPRIPEQLRPLLPPGAVPEMDEDEMPRRTRPLGTGSGSIMSADGYILTNNHVIENASKITVRLVDGREFEAKVVGRDPKSDLAVIKIDAEGLTYAKFGDSDAMEVGDWVLAFGSPFGFDQTMTQGIISAKSRQVNIIGMNNPALMGLTYENFLQTDAAINPGNSGGPLVNLKAEIIGVNTAIASSSRGYNGIGFSIPANDAKWIMESLVKTGKVVRGYLGVEIVDVREGRVKREVQALGYDKNTGVLVKTVRPDTPAGKGGLQVGDIVQTVNGTRIESINELRTIVARTRPGEDITLGVWRKGKTVDLKFPVGTQPESALAMGAPGGVEAPATPMEALGLSVREEQGKGVVVTDVEAGGMAAAQGIRKGDTILSVQGKAVGSVAAFQEAIKGWDPQKKGIHLSVRSPDGTERLLYMEQE